MAAGVAIVDVVVVDVDVVDAIDVDDVVDVDDDAAATVVVVVDDAIDVDDIDDAALVVVAVDVVVDVEANVDDVVVVVVVVVVVDDVDLRFDGNKSTNFDVDDDVDERLLRDDEAGGASDASVVAGSIDDSGDDRCATCDSKQFQKTTNRRMLCC